MRANATVAWLEVDLEAQPIEGTLRASDGKTAAFIGWLGLTAALERLRADRHAGEVDEAP